MADADRLATLMGETIRTRCAMERQGKEDAVEGTLYEINILSNLLPKDKESRTALVDRALTESLKDLPEDLRARVGTRREDIAFVLFNPNEEYLARERAHWRTVRSRTEGEPLLLGTAVPPRPDARADRPEYPPGTPESGARYVSDGEKIRFGISSSRATKIDVYLFDRPLGADEKLTIALEKEPSSDVWSATVPVSDLHARGITGTVYYGYRAWGPNWPFVPTWTKGSRAGFSGEDVDGQGNRFNANKLLIDPYAAELSHDPTNPSHDDGTAYASGPDHRLRETGRIAPKGIVLRPDTTSVGDRPTRPLKDEIIYEVHLRGLTKQDPSIPEVERGTYAGAARKAGYLETLGVTAIEFLPVHETENDRNDVKPGSEGDNYWGYSSLGYFAPDRRYARDKGPGGPTREFKAMVKAFHDRGIKVYLDVVYNHTGEGGIYGGDQFETANVLSWRGLDNPTYYELTEDNRFYYDNTGVNGNFNAAHRVVRDQIMDSLRYWSQAMGVDGFRFDLAPILGNTLTRQRASAPGGFTCQKRPGDWGLTRAENDLPVRPAAGGPGVDLIAEPWAATGDTQQQGNFPRGWAEWNDRFRDAFRRSQNKLGLEDVTPGELATRFAGSRDLYQDDGRKPWHSINFIAAHDGLCLRDLYSYTDDAQKAWDQGRDPILQRQATRNGFALPMLSAGVPMFTGGDEMYRTQNGNANAYTVDEATNHLNWANLAEHQGSSVRSPTDRLPAGAPRPAPRRVFRRPRPQRQRPEGPDLLPR
ncbi:MAG: isoamylase [Singulisphaera sp.]